MVCLALVAQLFLVTAHAASHVADSPVTGASQHCAVCSMGRDLVSVPAAPIDVCRPTFTTQAALAQLPAPTGRCAIRAIFARGPPPAASPATVG